MQAAKMKNKIWAKAMETSCYFQNITPTKVVIKKIPWEILIW
jgi:hypothetical protein